GFIGREGRRLTQPGAAPSERESEVLRLIAFGYSNKEIANQLALSVKTVEAHKANAMRKLALSGRIDIVNYAILQGWLKDSAARRVLHAHVVRDSPDSSPSPFDRKVRHPVTGSRGRNPWETRRLSHPSPERWPSGSTVDGFGRESWGSLRFQRLARARTPSITSRAAHRGAPPSIPPTIARRNAPL